MTKFMSASLLVSTCINFFEKHIYVGKDYQDYSSREAKEVEHIFVTVCGKFPQDVSRQKSLNMDSSSKK